MALPDYGTIILPQINSVVKYFFGKKVIDMPYGDKNFNTQDNGEIQDDTAVEWLRVLNNVIDERIQQRLNESDIMHYYDAQIVEIVDGLNAVAEYDDYKYDVKNATGIQFVSGDKGKYIKMGTTDGINHYALYLLSPNAVDIEKIERMDRDIKELKSKGSKN